MGIIAFSIGALNFYWYGIIIVLAITFASVVTWWQAKLYNEPAMPVVDLVLCCVPTSIICARAYYVLTNWELYRANPVESLYLWQGGLSIYGAYLGFLVALWFYIRANQLSFSRWADIFAPGLALGQAIGQWANFINQEAFGYPTDLPWGIYIDFAFRPPGYEQFEYFHPVYMYESGWNAAVFLLLLLLGWLQRKNGKLKPGSLFALVSFLFAAGHFYFVGMRLDSVIIDGFRLGQVMSIIVAAVSLFSFIYLNYRRPFNPGQE